MSSRWLLVLLLVPLFSSIAFSQKLINGFTREFAIHGLPTGFSLKSFDVTGDSVSELFVLTGSQLWVFDGKTFSMILKDSVAPGTANLSPADVNRDSNMDLVATRSNSEVLVWYGPDFHNRSSYTAPRGFGVFGVRNRNDGQVEFSFGIGHEHSYQYPGEFCPEYWNDGHLYRYLDTTFVFMDSANLPGTPVGMVPYYALGFNELFPLQYGYRDHNCMPNYFSRSYSLARIGNQVTSGPLFYSYSCFGCGVRCPPASVGPYSVGNIDNDAGLEFIVRWEEWGFSCQPNQSKLFTAYDILSGTQQWARNDSSTQFMAALFTVDLDDDELQELLSYRILGGKPHLTEYQTSNGVILGSSELPFTPSKLLISLFGQSAVPKVLLGHGDSVVVFRIGCAANKGDMNADGNVTVFDVTMQLNCVFLREGDCNLCFADVNCDGILSATDVVLELLAVFLERPFPCL